MLLVAMYNCDDSCSIIPAVDAFMLDRPLASSRRKRMHHINQRHDHDHLKVLLLEKQQDGDKDNDEASQEQEQEQDATRNLVDKLSAEQRQALLQRKMNSERDNDNENDDETQGDGGNTGLGRNRRNLIINGAAAALSVVTAVAATNLYTQTVYTPAGFQRFSSTKFIAATGDPAASQGVIGNAPDEQWGVWNQDPGPRGVFLRDYKALLLDNKQSTSDSDGHDIVAPAGWKFDKNDWWLEEHGT
jgi:hypothetical protein